MTDLRQAAQQALEALDCINSPLYVREINKVGAAMSALRAALAQVEPVQRRAAIDEIHAAWFLAGVGMAGGNWERFFDMLPPHLKQQAEPVQRNDEGERGL